VTVDAGAGGSMPGYFYSRTRSLTGAAGGAVADAWPRPAGMD
jgi:hypothetical protein